MKKLKIAILFGGKSVEHEVSVRSARSVYQALDRSKYEVIAVAIDKNGQWRLCRSPHLLDEKEESSRQQVPCSGEVVVLTAKDGQAAMFGLAGGGVLETADVVFPVLHGPFGEDGTVQGMLELLEVAFVGSGVLSSAACMDKDVTKRLLRQAGINTAKHLVLTAVPDDGQTIFQELGTPVFVKPACGGSSVGITRAADSAALRQAVELGLSYDRKVLVEEQINGREIECSILGNQTPRASLAGEIIPHARHGFYSYEAKYLDASGASLKIPADLPDAIMRQVQTIALQAYTALGCEGMARVDLFLVTQAGGDCQILVNEINTIPGFTGSISMYPKLWAASGLAFADLVDRLIELGLERHALKKSLQSSAF